METSELPRLVDRITQDLESTNRILAAGGVPEDLVHAMRMVMDGKRLEESMLAWGSLLCTAAEWERHTRLRTACVQILRTVGPKVDWASAAHPAVHVLITTGGILSSALAALDYSGAAEALSSQPPEQQASFFRQWRSEAAVVCQLLNAIADAPSAALSPQELPEDESFGGLPAATLVAGVLMRCLSWQDSFLRGLFRACLAQQRQGHELSGDSASARDGSCGSGQGGSDGGSGGDSGSSRGFVSCEQEYGECVQLSEALVRLLVKLPHLQAALPAMTPFATRPVVLAFDLPDITASFARDWVIRHLTPEAAQRQLPAVLHYVATLVKALRVAAGRAMGMPADSSQARDVISLCGGLVECMWLVEMVLKEHPHVAEGKRHLTRYLRTTGLLVFECIPAMKQSSMAVDSCKLWDPKRKFSIRLLLTIEAAGLMDEAVRGGLGPLLQTMFDALERGEAHREAAQMLRECARLCAAPPTASLALAVGAQGLLAAAVVLCRRMSEARQLRSEHAAVLMASTGALLRAVCGVLDSSGSTSLATDHAQLLSGFSDVLVNYRGSICDSATGAAISVRSKGPRTWAAVQASLLPAIEAASREQMAAAQAGEAAGMDRVFRDVAVSPWTCTNPSCTNLTGCSEAQLHFMTCGGCGEARYCCKECQKSDWRRHKVACRILKESKT